MVSYESYGINEPGEWFLITYLATKYSIGVEQLFSGVLLIVAVVMIRKFLMEHGMEG